MPTDPKPTPSPTPDPGKEVTAENLISSRVTTAGNPIATSDANSATHEVVQPLGQATSPESDAASKAALLPDDEDAKSDDALEIETQRVSWTLPKSTVDAVKAHADANDLSLSEAADALLTTSTGYVSATRLNY